MFAVQGCKAESGQLKTGEAVLERVSELLIPMSMTDTSPLPSHMSLQFRGPWINEMITTNQPVHVNGRLVKPDDVLMPQTPSLNGLG